MYEFEAIGTHWWLERLDKGTFTEAIRAALADYTTLFEQRYSRFREDSPIAQLARDGKVRNIPAEMFAMLNFASKLYDDTEGSFTPLVGNTLQGLGYGNLLDGTAPSTSLNSRASGLSWTKKSVKVHKGTILDFGGFGKGWLIDEYAKILRKHGVKEFIVNGGGDLYVEASAPISFALEHPYDPRLKIGDIQIQKGALAASSIVKRSWEQGGEIVHHIIDPTTGKPADSDVVATFVCAHTALEADSLATALLIRPQLQKKLETLYNAEALIITNNQLA
jgi:thiamine biosynthesis lipoprotein